MPLSMLPEHDERLSSGFTGSYVYGTEYQTSTYNIFPSSAHNQNAPCARCNTNDRLALMMIPGLKTCPNHWTKEYEGRF